MFKKILVPLDGSMLAEKALPYAVRLANRLNAQLYLIRVVEAPRLVGNLNKLTKDAESYLANLTHLLSSHTLKPHTEALRLHTSVIRGEAVTEICSFARNLEIDLVVMSTHGRSGLPRLLAGSVATRILHQLNTPVMLVRPFEQKHDQLLAETFSGIGEPYSNRFEGNGGRLVLPLDGTKFAETALGPACELAASLQAKLHLLNVRGDGTQFYYGDLAGMGYMETRYYEVSPDDEMAPVTYLGDVRKQMSEKGLRAVIGIRKGNIAEQIVAYACQNSADAIVMATHAPSELGWFLSGSTAAAVMRQSHLPVLMIPVHSEADAIPARPNNVEMRELTRSH